MYKRQALAAVLLAVAEVDGVDRDLDGFAAVSVLVLVVAARELALDVYKRQGLDGLRDAVVVGADAVLVGHTTQQVEQVGRALVRDAEAPQLDQSYLCLLYTSRCV